MKTINLSGLDMRNSLVLVTIQVRTLLILMDETMEELNMKESRIHRNKLWRNLKKDQKYITRIKRSFPHWYICSSNKWRKAISWTELYNAKNTFRFKTMSTPW